MISPDCWLEADYVIHPIRGQKLSEFLFEFVCPSMCIYKNFPYLMNWEREDISWNSFFKYKFMHTLGCIIFGPFWSVWCKIALAEEGVSVHRGLILVLYGQSHFKSHDFFIMEKWLVSEEFEGKVEL
jgi:hypothetical protein